MRTQEAFKISVLDCAKRLNLKFSRTYINKDKLVEYVFHCPLRKDKNASIYINEAKNVWYDNGGITDGGGIIQFINYLYKNDLRDTKSALAILDIIYPENQKRNNNFKHIREIIQKKNSNSKDNNLKNEQKPVFELVEIKELFSYPLKNYLKYDRKINIEIAKKHTKEIIYKHTPSKIRFYGIGFKSGETWTIRRKGFKGFLGKGASINTIDKKTDTILIFEGFIDFLSYLTIKKIKNPQTSTIVLNSAVFINHAIEYIEKNKNIKKVNYYRDRDETGKQSLEKLKKKLKNIIIHDKSESYSKYKDLNEWLVDNAE